MPRLPPPVGSSLVRRGADALRKRVDGVLERMTETYELSVLRQRYRKNFLTHGVDFLRGDDEIPVFLPGEAGLPKWRPIPGPKTASYSEASLTYTDDGTILLSGLYGGARTGLQLIDGEGDQHSEGAIGQGACGMGSTARWDWDVSQHHWLEVRLRTDGRHYQLAMQADAEMLSNHWLWRAPIPLGEHRPPPAPRQRPARRGPYGELGVDRDATEEQLRTAYVALAKQRHPDIGGDEEHFKASSSPASLSPHWFHLAHPVFAMYQRLCLLDSTTRRSTVRTRFSRTRRGVLGTMSLGRRRGRRYRWWWNWRKGSLSWWSCIKS